MPQKVVGLFLNGDPALYSRSPVVLEVFSPGSNRFDIRLPKREGRTDLEAPETVQLLA